MSRFVIPDERNVLVVDISKWQDDPNTPLIPNFERMKARGVDGVICKCGEGKSLDRAFLPYVEALKSAKMPYGFYWYYNNLYDPRVQVSTFISAVEQVGYPQLGLWLDLEDRGVGSFRGWKKWYDFLYDLERKYPNKLIGIYTGHFYFTEYTQNVGIPHASLQWFKKFPLWIASYGRPPKPTKPWGDKWTLWQFTDVLDGQDYGVESKELDGNYFNGDMEAYEKFFGISKSDQSRRLVKTIYVYSDGTQEEVEVK